MVRPDMPAHFPATAHSCRLELVAGVGCSPASCSCLHGQELHIYCAKKIYLVLPVGEALLTRGGHHALPRELQQRGVEDLVDGGLAGVAHVLLDVRTVHEGQVDGPGDVGRGQNENV